MVRRGSAARGWSGQRDGSEAAGSPKNLRKKSSVKKTSKKTSKK
jgi:hypothetical protein